MNRLFLILIIGTTIAFQSCGKNKDKVAAIATVDNKEEKTLLSDVNIHNPNDSTLDLLVGKWFIPNIADINITFYKDSTFVFNDFNTQLMKDEVLRGRFELNGNKLILKYNDRPQQTFSFKKGSDTDDNYYITKGKNYYFVKSDID